MKAIICTVVMGLVTGFSAAALAQAPPPPVVEVAIDKLALTLIPAKNAAKLKVSTPGFADGADIPFEYTQFRDNKFPGLAWSKGPRGTRSYIVIMQDTDGRRNDEPILHWTMFNIPAKLTKLAPGLTAPPAGAMFGPNVVGLNHAYMGPRPRPGPKHRYRLQVFAMDIALPADATLTWDALKAAMAGHVLASGQVVGLGQADPSAPPPASPPASPPAPPK
ncbi:MAG TPA: YbhB/YbcL family Raf kinase inhibitor-like protein [Caulobacterales bacterium]|nr:YbhB/YbcL family Raf kinase inhibitor-like protein [Caulobacterales bacterium]